MTLRPRRAHPPERPTSLIRPDWHAVVVCASGPSFSPAQADAVTVARAADRLRVIVVNDNWRRVPTADVLFAIDRPWWLHHGAALAASGFAGEKWTSTPPVAKEFGARLVGAYNVGGLTDRAGYVTPAATAGTARSISHTCSGRPASRSSASI